MIFNYFPSAFLEGYLTISFAKTFLLQLTEVIQSNWKSFVIMSGDLIACHSKRLRAEFIFSVQIRVICVLLQS